jgi:tRNA pseudouridine55 synthase
VGDKADRLPTLPDIETAVTGFRGLIQQQPPPYSAKKVGGIRAYKLARQDAALSLAPVEVEIFEFKALALEGTRLRFRVRCSSGTYVRSLAHELGVAVGVPAHLGRLRRTRVGEFDTASAFTLDELEQHRSRGDAEKCLIPASRLLPELPAVVAPLDAASKVLQGRAVNLPEFSRAPMVRIFSSDESLLAIGSRIAGTLFQPRIVFPRQR